MVDPGFAQALKAAIARDGPMRLDRYMAACNAHYYATRDPFGQAGDFITAPEIFQGFGECLGLWAAAVWENMGRPAPVLLVELGPGRGTLMADALRAIARAAPGFRAALSVHLVETSPALKAFQLAAVPEATLHDRIEDLPEDPAIVLANEFLDALPVRQFQRTEAGWLERFLGEGLVPLDLPARETPQREAAPGEWVELAPARTALVHGLAARLASGGGAALVIDYGHLVSAPGTTLQALRAHTPESPFASPGHADLTAHVDFQELAQATRAAGAIPFGPRPQGRFLAELGLLARAESLARAHPARRAEFEQAVQRLVAADAMGMLFKAMAVCHPSLPTPPGFF